MPATRRQRIAVDILFFSWASNVWFGISTLAVILIYSSLGSAIPPLRQHPWFDMTEMEWFLWWPFKLMIAVMCINLVTVTLRQIPFRLDNLGVWMIHTGILVLVGGSFYYFGTKLEGDVPVFRRRAVIELPGVSQPVSLLIRPGNQIEVDTEAGPFRFTVSQIFPDWSIASGEDTGKTAYMSWIDVVTPTQSYTRQLLAGYPEYTEDILPDRTRAKKTLGRPLVDESVKLSLDYEPQDEFYLMDSAALFVRALGREEWIERPIKDRPHYSEHVSSYDQVALSTHQPWFVPRPIDRPIPPGEVADPLAGYDVRLTAYLRYAFMSSTWRDGGSRLYPYARVALVAGPMARRDYDLIALDPDRNSAEQGQLALRWVESADQIDRLVKSAEGRLIFQVPDTETVLDVPIHEMPRASEGGGFVPIPGTELAYRLKNVVGNLLMQSGSHRGETMSIATVEIKTPETTITRFVSNVEGATRDLGTQGGMVAPDEIIDVKHVPGIGSRVLLVTGPGDVGTHVLLDRGDGVIDRQDIEVGESVPLSGGVSIELVQLMTHAVEEVLPRPVPPRRRNRDARESFSMIKVDLSKGDWSKSVWLDFNRYAFPNEQYAIAGRFTFSPTTIHLPDGQHVELMYSRERRPLPTPIALEAFVLDTHAGGYTGQTISIRDFVSQLRFKTDDGWSPTMQMSSNCPASKGGFWYFQSTWDPPSRGYGGMNYTGLGVGNRNGVHIQLAGTCISVAGMIFAFYFKPIIRRRRMEAARQRAEVERSGPRMESGVDEAMEETVATS